MDRLVSRHRKYMYSLSNQCKLYRSFRHATSFIAISCAVRSLVSSRWRC